MKTEQTKMSDPICTKHGDWVRECGCHKRTQHTPEPWIVGANGLICAGNLAIAQPYNIKDQTERVIDERGWANARLLSAAPTYDKLLREVLEQVEETNTINLDLGSRIQAELAKAERSTQ